MVIQFRSLKHYKLLEFQMSSNCDLTPASIHPKFFHFLHWNISTLLRYYRWCASFQGQGIIVHHFFFIVFPRKASLLSTLVIFEMHAIHIVIKVLCTSLYKFINLRRRCKHPLLVFRKGWTRAVDFPSTVLLLSGFWPLRLYQMTRVGFQYTNYSHCCYRNAAYIYFYNPRFWKLAAERNVSYSLESCSIQKGGLSCSRGRERLKKCQNCINPTQGWVCALADS